MLDRIDLFIEVPRVDFEKLTDRNPGEPSVDIRVRVEKAKSTQLKRYANLRLISNSEMGPAEIRKYCSIDDEALALLREAMNRLQLSARAFHRTLKISRTIADLSASERIQTHHLAEALQYRSRALI
jgi:magnesium chelatase family protein